MGRRPSADLSIDREDNDRGYDCGKCPECFNRGVTKTNCRWATVVEQIHNQRPKRPRVLCGKGHPLEGVNLGVNRSQRFCRACRRAGARAYRTGAARERLLRRRRELRATRRVTKAPPTHCPHGHEYTPENTALYQRPNGRGAERVCRECYRARHRRDYRRLQRKLGANV